MTTKTCPECGGSCKSINQSCEACRSREQVTLRKKRQDNFIRQLNSEEITDSIKADNKKREEFDKDFQEEFDKRFR